VAYLEIGAILTTTKIANIYRPFLAERPTWRPFFSSFSPHLPSKFRVNTLTKILPKNKKGKNLGKYPRGIYLQVFTRTLGDAEQTNTHRVFCVGRFEIAHVRFSL
jgi:hypothetical protein